MNKVILLILSVILYTYDATGQTPLYRYSSYDTGGQHGSVVYSGTLPDQHFRLQAYYYPSDFPGMPSGAISNFYYRTDTISGLADTIVYYNFNLGLNSTTDSLFSFDSSGHGAFNSGSGSFDAIGNCTVTGMSQHGTWKKISFSYPLFLYYDNHKNLLLDIYCDAASSAFSWMASKSFPGKMMVYQSGRLTKGVSTQYALDIGFDIETTDVAALHNIKSFGLFPNPTSDNRFNVSFDLAAPASKVSVVLTDAVGRSVYGRTYNNTGRSFFQEVAVNSASKGIYFLKVSVDGEIVIRRMVLQ